MCCTHVKMFLLVCCVLYFVSGVEAKKTLVKRPEIYSLHIQSDIKYRFATTKVCSQMANRYNATSEALFDVSLPADAFISSFSMEIDGVVYHGDVKEKFTAREQYEAAKRKGESAAHIAARPRETNKFDLEVALAPRSKISFNLTYQQILQRKRGLYEHVIYINPGQRVRDMEIQVRIQESRNITDLRVQPRTNEILMDDSGVVVSQPTPDTAYIVAVPNVNGDKVFQEFKVFYDVSRGHDVGDVLVVNGFFVHFFAPTSFRPIPTDILFILDTSGSMEGTKIVQLREAMEEIIYGLGEQDRFSIITFNDRISYWEYDMVAGTEENTDKATKFINKTEAKGGTNINAALVKGLQLLSGYGFSSSRSRIIVFLTDGQPTHGEINRKMIRENVKMNNILNIPIFSLAFGEDADFKLMKEMSVENGGMSRKIYESSDAKLQMTGFYEEISTLLLNNLTVKYLEHSVDQSSLTTPTFQHLFQGSEILIAGKTNDLGANTIPLEVVANGIDGEIVLRPDEHRDLPDPGLNLTTMDDLGDITEKMWAYLSIKQLLLRGEDDRVENKTALHQKALDLSLKYQFVTPLTSMVVTKVNQSDDQQPLVIDDDEARPRGKQSPISSGREEDAAARLGDGDTYGVTYDMYGYSNEEFGYYYDEDYAESSTTTEPHSNESDYYYTKDYPEGSRTTEPPDVPYTLFISLPSSDVPLCLHLPNRSERLYNLLSVKGTKGYNIKVKMDNNKMQKVMIRYKTTKVAIKRVVLRYINGGTSFTVSLRKTQTGYSSDVGIKMTENAIYLNHSGFASLTFGLGRREELSLHVDLDTVSQTARAKSLLGYLLRTGARIVEGEDGDHASLDGQKTSKHFSYSLVKRRSLDTVTDSLTDCWSFIDSDLLGDF